MELASDLGQAYLAATAHCSLATAYLDAGEPDRCVDLLVGATGGPDLPLTVASIRCIFYDALTRAELELGRPSEAEGWAERSAEHAGRLGLPLARAQADRAKARVLMQAGDTAAAAELALASARAAEWVGAAIEAARSRLVAGQARAAGDDRGAALTTLRSAPPTSSRPLERSASMPRRGVSCAVWARGPRHPRLAVRGEGGIDALTGREREIAELVTDRKTNQEIADQLFLTVKTIETHLRNVFRKLGVSSRVEVARLLERERREESR